MIESGYQLTAPHGCKGGIVREVQYFLRHGRIPLEFILSQSITILVDYQKLVLSTRKTYLSNVNNENIWINYIKLSMDNKGYIQLLGAQNIHEI